MNTITVSSKDELKEAQKNGYVEIVVVGPLAHDLKRTKQIAYLGGGSIAAIALATAANSFMGSSRSSAVPPGFKLTGIEISAIIMALSMGISVLVALYKDYEEISFKDGEMKFRRKSKSV